MYHFCKGRETAEKSRLEHLLKMFINKLSTFSCKFITLFLLKALITKFLRFHMLKKLLIVHVRCFLYLQIKISFEIDFILHIVDYKIFKSRNIFIGFRHFYRHLSNFENVNNKMHVIIVKLISYALNREFF